MTAELYRKYGLKNNFKLDKNAFRAFVLEMSPLDWPRVNTILEFMQSSGIARSILGSKAKRIENLQGRVSEGATIIYQRHMRGHIGYGLKTQTVQHGEIVSLNFPVETCVKKDFVSLIDYLPKPVSYTHLTLPTN